MVGRDEQQEPSGGRRAAPRDKLLWRRGAEALAQRGVRNRRPLALRGGWETRSAGGSGAVFWVRLEAVDEVILRLRGSRSLAICYKLVVEDEFVRMLAL